MSTEKGSRYGRKSARESCIAGRRGAPSGVAAEVCPEEACNGRQRLERVFAIVNIPIIFLTLRLRRGKRRIRSSTTPRVRPPLAAAPRQRQQLLIFLCRKVLISGIEFEDKVLSTVENRRQTLRKNHRERRGEPFGDLLRRWFEHFARLLLRKRVRMDEQRRQRRLWHRRW